MPITPDRDPPLAIIMTKEMPKKITIKNASINLICICFDILNPLQNPVQSMLSDEKLSTHPYV